MPAAYLQEELVIFNNSGNMCPLFKIIVFRIEPLLAQYTHTITCTCTHMHVCTHTQTNNKPVAVFPSKSCQFALPEEVS